MAIAKSWCFTLNNYTEEEYNAIVAWDVSKMVVGKEMGENGTPHLQGAVAFKQTHRLTGVKKLQPRAHWEPMAARGDGAYAYCRKDGDFIEINNKEQGRRTDRELAYAAATQKKTLREFVAEENPGLPGIELFKTIKLVLDEPDE